MESGKVEFIPVDLRKLAEPFPAKDLDWRVGRDGKTGAGKVWSKVLCYVDARAIMDRLDAIVGPENWKDRYWKEGGGTMCGLSVRIDGEWVEKIDGAEDTDIEAFKGGISKALVRAAVKWGIGRYLYNLSEDFAKIVDRDTRGARWTNSNKAGEYFWLPPDLPAWALPGGSGDPNSPGPGPGAPPPKGSAPAPGVPGAGAQVAGVGRDTAGVQLPGGARNGTVQEKTAERAASLGARLAAGAEAAPGRAPGAQGPVQRGDVPGPRGAAPQGQARGEEARTGADNRGVNRETAQAAPGKIPEGDDEGQSVRGAAQEPGTQPAPVPAQGVQGVPGAEHRREWRGAAAPVHGAVAQGATPGAGKEDPLGVQARRAREGNGRGAQERAAGRVPGPAERGGAAPAEAARPPGARAAEGAGPVRGVAPGVPGGPGQAARGAGQGARSGARKKPGPAGAAVHPEVPGGKVLDEGRPGVHAQAVEGRAPGGNDPRVPEGGGGAARAGDEGGGAVLSQLADFDQAIAECTKPEDFGEVCRVSLQVAHNPPTLGELWKMIAPRLWDLPEGVRDGVIAAKDRAKERLQMT